MDIVFVCTGNICRSPMAEGLLRHRWEQEGRQGLTVSSMGVHGLDDSPATELAQEVCREHGVDISAHRSRSVVAEEIQDADFVFCMEPAHTKFLHTYFPWHKDHIVLLAAWPNKPKKRKHTIKDPMGGSKSLYQEVFDLIHHHIDRIIPLL